MDTKRRSWVKATTWRLIAVTVLVLVSYLVTGEWKEVTAITVLYHGIQVALYYGHERLWEHIPWGQVKHPLAEIPVNQRLTPEDMEAVKEHLRQLGYMD